jgi:tetratricopeptide (TPR) repeat protein
VRRGTPAYNWTLITTAAVIIVVALWTMGAPPWFGVAFMVSIAACGLYELGRRLLFRSRMRALQRAVEAEDCAAAENELDKLVRKAKGAQATAVFASIRASIPLLDERFGEGRARLAALDVELLPPMLRAAYDNDVAWAMAHDGAAAEALPLAERAVATAKPEAFAELAAATVGTLGVVQLKTGRAAEARATLERALALGGSKRMMATRAFYLGEALRELGQSDEAATSYDRAVRTMPEGVYGKKARAALAALAAEKPYRG